MESLSFVYVSLSNLLPPDSLSTFIKFLRKIAWEFRGLVKKEIETICIGNKVIQSGPKFYNTNVNSPYFSIEKYKP